MNLFIKIILFDSKISYIQLIQGINWNSLKMAEQQKYQERSGDT